MSEPTPEQIQKAEAAAQSQAGNLYVLGGLVAAGFDCAAFQRAVLEELRLADE